MKLFRCTLTLTIFFCIGVTTGFAQQVKTVSMFDMETEIQAQEELPAYQLNRQYLSLNPSVFRRGYLQQGDRLILPVGDAGSEYRVERISSHTENTYSVLARGTGGEERFLSFSVADGKIQGNIHMHDRGELYQMSWDPVRNANYLSHIDYSELDIVACPGHIEPDFADSSSQQFRSDPPDIGMQQVTIDVLILYTDRGEQWIENNVGDVDLYIAEIFNRAQQALDNSEVEIQFRMVHAAKTAYDEDNDTETGTTLGKLQATGDGNMDEAHALRDTYGADLVALLADVDDVGGIAYIMGSTAGAPAWAFSINRVQQLLFTSTFAHELGHNMGNHHSRDQSSSPAPAQGGLHDYSTGWKWEGNDGRTYVSVMAYDEDAELEAPYFSNPDVSYMGAPTGSYNGIHAPADNARSMNGIRGVVADYKQADNDPRPSTPVPTAPQDGETGLSRSTTLEWSVAAKAENYRVQLSASNNFGNPMVDATQSGTSYSVEGLNYLTTYYWRVRASNAAGNSDWSSTNRFTTVISPPENVTTSGPVDGSIQVDIRPNLQWQSSERAAEYDVQVALEDDFSEPVISGTSAATSFMSEESLEFATEYYWRVRAVNEGGTSDWTAPQGFTTLVNETKINMNYPNPFPGSTTIQYQLAEQTDVLLEIYDPLGRKVRTLVDGEQQPRVYNLQFDAGDLASGVYMIRLVTGNTTDVLGMTLVR
ncbi:MAG: zinc-dependent metalloprotease family protein [Balneolaceae bacterium]|nr:zinc-dependent metalloprotease family protein [Balneolaceae bacterium]